MKDQPTSPKPLPEHGPSRGFARGFGLMIAIGCLAVIFAPVLLAALS